MVSLPTLPTLPTLAILLLHLLATTAAQFQQAVEEQSCGEGLECVTITSCPRLLQLLKQVMMLNYIQY